MRSPEASPQDLLFHDTEGTFLNPDTVLDQFHGLLKQAGLPRMRFHDLRHSAATLLLALGVQLKVVQEMLGHSNITITGNTYGHVLPSMERSTADRMDTLFRGEDQED